MKRLHSITLSLLSIALVACVSTQPEQPKSDASSSALSTARENKPTDSHPDTHIDTDNPSISGKADPSPSETNSTDTVSNEDRNPESPDHIPSTHQNDPSSTTQAITLTGGAIYITADFFAPDEADEAIVTDGIDRKLDTASTLPEQLKKVIILGDKKPNGGRRTDTVLDLTQGKQSTQDNYTDGSFTSRSYTNSNYTTQYTFYQQAYSMFGHWVDEDGAGYNSYYFYQGQATDNMPTRGKATYTGKALIGSVDDISTHSFTSAQHQGVANFEVNFEDATLTGTIKGTGQENQHRSLSISASISGHHFNADGEVKVSGSFFGPDAAELAGQAFNQQHIATFGAKKSP